MKFRYEFDIKKLPRPITHAAKLFLTGSCFTENIGEKLRRYKFNILESPHGILFNPVSVSESIQDCIVNKQYSEEELFYLNDSWHSWKHHSRFSGNTPSEAIEKINTSISKAHQFLKYADYAFITLGSAWVYRLSASASNGKEGEVAANNHKAPSEWFSRQLLQPADIAATLQTMIRNLLAFNKDLHIIFTISPVRHLREGAVENNRSKALLIQAVHEMVDSMEHLYYFPAYELVLDDLRDYRFFAEDLVHPNYFATRYVWEKFIGASTDDKTQSLMEEIETINSAYHHKPFNPLSEQHLKFKQSMLQRIQLLQQRFSYIDFTKEKEYFSHT